jgi:hypothetical protein
MKLLSMIAKMFGLKTSDTIKNQNIVKDSSNVSIINAETYHAAPEKVTLSTSKQVISIERFVEEYENSRLATPISNQFFGRESELEKLQNSLLDNPITIVTGAGGVGKTRLCREVVIQFEKEHPDYSTLCIVNKLDSIYSELRLIFDSNKNYLIFIDDANRQNQHLSQLLAVMREKHVGQIHLLITVRDYAVNFIKVMCTDFKLNSLNIEKMVDESIIPILGSKDFGITNPIYLKKILAIADGNPRLAIMAARVVLEKKNIEVLNNVSDVFEQYFSTYLKDHKELENVNVRKTLGLIGFFHIIDLGNESFYNTLLEQFDLELAVFNQNIDLLENLELIEFSEDKNIVRIAEQNLGNYFFFCCFIRDNQLSFGTLLKYYYETHQKRFTEGIVSANNHFGGDVVEAKLTPILRNHLQDIKFESNTKKNKFFELFWFYLSDETLAYIDNEIKPIDIPISSHFETQEKEIFFWLNNEVVSFIELLRKFLLHPFPTNFEIALELGFENVRRQPVLMPSWIKMLTNTIGFDYEDAKTGFFRQTRLFELLIRNTKENKPEYVSAFFPLATFFLKTEYSINKSERNYKVTFYQYPIPFNEVTQSFRAKIWQFLLDNYEIDSGASYKLLENFCSRFSKNDNAFADFDLTYILPLINQKLNPNDVNHCLLVHQYCFQLRRVGIETSDLKALKKQFKNQKFEWLAVLDKNKYRNKNWYEFNFEDDYEQFLKAKEDEIRLFFDFKNLDEFVCFYQTYLELIKVNNSISNDLAWSLDVVLENHWHKRESLCLSFLNYMISEKKVNGFIPCRVFMSAFSELEKTTNLYRFIVKCTFKEKDSWLMEFFNSVPLKLVNGEFYNGFVDLVKNLSYHYIFHWETIGKFISINSNIHSDWLKMVHDKKENGYVIYVWHGFFKNTISHFSNEDLPLLKNLYFGQIEHQEYFDLGHQDFFVILNRDNTFLEDFIMIEHKESGGIKQGNEHTNLGIVWELENAEYLIEKGIILSRSLVKVFMSPFKFYANVFFYDVKSEHTERIHQFFINFVSKHSTKAELIQVIVNIVKTSFRNYYENVFRHFLSLNQNLEDFKKIQWEERTGEPDSAGYTIWGEMNAHELTTILKWVEEMPNPSKYLHHKAYLRKQISNAEAYAQSERRRNFSRDNF